VDAGVAGVLGGADYPHEPTVDADIIEAHRPPRRALKRVTSVARRLPVIHLPQLLTPQNVLS